MGQLGGPTPDEQVANVACNFATRDFHSGIIDTLDDHIGADPDAQAKVMREFADSRYTDEENLGRSFYHDLFASLARAGHDIGQDRVLSVALEAYWSQMRDEIEKHFDSFPKPLA